MKILLTNDDGINAEGLSNLYNLLSNFGSGVLFYYNISLNNNSNLKCILKDPTY